MSDNTPWFEGIKFPMVHFSPEILREVRDKFVVKDEDTITVTYPKSGTNWLIEIVSLILSKGDPKWVQSVPNWDRSPWIESTGGYELVKGQKDPRVYTSHLPLHLFPKSFFSSKAKDTRSTVEKICQFLGKKLKPEETDLVLKYSSFQFMKENEMSNFTLLPHAYTTEGFTLLRKGTVGDWKNHFTVAQAEAFDKIYQEKMAGYPPKLFPWEEC